MWEVMRISSDTVCIGSEQVCISSGMQGIAPDRPPACWIHTTWPWGMEVVR
jgi:hypothetical protein